MMDVSKPRMWIRSLEVWQDGASVTDFMVNQINGLRDSEGDPLPDDVKSFLIDLLFLRVKPRRGRSLPKAELREAYKHMLFMEQQADHDPLNGDSPEQRVLVRLAKQLEISTAVIDQIVHPRKSRLKKRQKPNTKK